MNLKKGCFIAILSILVISPSMANSVEWSVVIKKPFSAEYPRNIECIGNSYIAVVESQNMKGKQGILLTKINENGHKQWEKYYEGNSATSLTISNACILLISDWQYAHLIKIDENGNEIWNHIFNFSCSFTTAKSIIYINKNYILSLGCDLEKSIVLKINENGTIIWKRNYNGTVSIAKTGDGYVIIKSPNMKIIPL